MKTLSFFILAFALLTFSGCWYEYEDDDPQTLQYSGRLDDCSFKGHDCIYSGYCVVTHASSSTMGDIKCRYRNHHDNGYDRLYFDGYLNSCYFNGDRCLSTSDCYVVFSSGGIGNIECRR